MSDRIPIGDPETWERDAARDLGLPVDLLPGTGVLVVQRTIDAHGGHFTSITDEEQMRRAHKAGDLSLEPIERPGWPEDWLAELRLLERHAG